MGDDLVRTELSMIPSNTLQFLELKYLKPHHCIDAKCLPVLYSVLYKSMCFCGTLFKSVGDLGIWHDGFEDRMTH